MNQAALARLFGAGHAFDHPVTVVATLAVAAVLAVTPLVIWLLARLGRIDAKLRTELTQRYLSWLVLTPPPHRHCRSRRRSALHRSRWG